MHNWYAVETEAEFRRQEWERAIAADARAALASTERVWPSWLHIPRLSLTGFKRLATPRWSFASPGASRQTADVSC